MAIPILRSTNPFSSTESKVFNFDVRGTSKQIAHNELEITLSSDTSTTVYNTRIQDFRYEHTLPANTLTNGSQYAAKVRVYDINENLIGESDPIFFYCFSHPDISVPTVSDNEVGNQTVLFEGIYSQAENEPLESYLFVLYDNNQIQISVSPQIYSTTIEYEFTELQNGELYHIELKVITVNGMERSTGLIPFTPRYIAPRFTSSIQLENLYNQAAVRVECNVIQIIGVPETDPVIYVDDEKADIKENKIMFDDGFSITENFTIQMWVEDIQDQSRFFEMKSKHGGKIIMELDGEIIRFKKMLDNDYIVQSLIGEASINPLNQIYICVKHVNGLYDLNYEEVVQ